MSYYVTLYQSHVNSYLVTHCKDTLNLGANGSDKIEYATIVFSIFKDDIGQCQMLKTGTSLGVPNWFDTLLIFGKLGGLDLHDLGVRDVSIKRIEVSVAVDGVFVLVGVKTFDNVKHGDGCRKDVHLLIVKSRYHYFRSAITQCDLIGCIRPAVAVVARAACSKVGNFDRCMTVHKDVLWLNVAVENTNVVKVRQSIHQLEHNPYEGGFMIVTETASRYQFTGA